MSKVPDEASDLIQLNAETGRRIWPAALRSLAQTFRTGPDFAEKIRLMDRAGRIIIAASRAELTSDLPGLTERVYFHTQPELLLPEGRQAMLVPCPGNQFIECAGRNMLPVLNAADGLKVVGLPFGSLASPLGFSTDSIVDDAERHAAACEAMAAIIESAKGSGKLENSILLHGAPCCQMIGNETGTQECRKIRACQESPKTMEYWLSADTREVLKRMRFGATWIIDRRTVELNGFTAVSATVLSSQRLVDHAAIELANTWGDAVLGTAISRIIPLIEEGDDLMYTALVPASLPSECFENTARAWESLRSQIEYRARRLDLMKADERLDESGDRGNENARSRIVEFLKGACGIVTDDQFTISVGEVLDGLTRALVQLDLKVSRHVTVNGDIWNSTIITGDSNRIGPSGRR